MRKVVAEVNDLDNVFFEVCNEPGAEGDWMDRMAEVIWEAEGKLPNRHLIANNGHPVPHMAIFNAHYDRDRLVRPRQLRAEPRRRLRRDRVRRRERPALPAAGVALPAERRRAVRQPRLVVLGRPPRRLGDEVGQEAGGRQPGAAPAARRPARLPRGLRPGEAEARQGRRQGRRRATSASSPSRASSTRSTSTAATAPSCRWTCRPATTRRSGSTPGPARRPGPRTCRAAGSGR